MKPDLTVMRSDPGTAPAAKLTMPSSPVLPGPRRAPVVKRSSSVATARTPVTDVRTAPTGEQGEDGGTTPEPPPTVAGPVPDTDEHVDQQGPARAGRSRQRHRTTGRVLADGALALLGAGVALSTQGTAAGGGSLALAGSFVVAVLVGLGITKVYDRSASSTAIQVRRITVALVRVAAAIALVSMAFSLDALRPLLLVGVAVTWALVVSLRLVLSRRRHGATAGRRLLVVGTERASEALVNRVRASGDPATEVVGVITESPGVTSVLEVPVRGGLDDLRRAVGETGATAVVVAAWSPMTQDDVRRLSWISDDLDVELLLEANLVDVDPFRVDVRATAGMLLLQVSPPRFGGLADEVRCLVDRGAALALLVVTWPLLLGVGVLVRLTSPGPAIFRQERIGRDGEPFQMLKFRSMYLDAEERLAEVRDHNLHGEGPLFKAREDPRVTPVGRFLRRFSLDELPQLWNVARGEMALVGPRPPLPREVAAYDQTTWRRLLVRPGLTGLWQVSGRSDLPWDESVRLDLRYVDNRSLGADLGILGRTGSAVFTGRGAY